MRLTSRTWWWLLAATLGLRLWSMIAVPLIDTSEPRYAEIARVMAASGDWITPWFKPGIPFWGKPPLSFWTEALAFRLFGVNEFSSRLPSLLAMMATLALIYACARKLFGIRQAQWATLIYSTALLPLFTAGAVLTDPFLVLGTTLCMAAFVLAPQSGSPLWRYGFFIGISIGLLAKGPLALVLVGGAVVPWMLLHRNARETMSALPWGLGILLTAVLTLPWYVAAEIKTPGFLHYFIVGEHFLRFIDKGWTGDLYGSAHKRPYGSVWLDLLLGAAPWSVAGVWVLLKSVSLRVGRSQIRAVLGDSRITYLLAWTLFTPVFFTLAGNILWTYVLPALPALAILAGAYASQLETGTARRAVALLSMAALPLAVAVGCLVITLHSPALKTEKSLVAHAAGIMGKDDRLFYLEDLPYSARFYSGGTAGVVALDDLAHLVSAATAGVFVAVAKQDEHAFDTKLAHPMAPAFKDSTHTLFRLRPEDIRHPA